jgi:predicted carbohydrate-binding protein with CBM5 and CBM33 domain
MKSYSAAIALAGFASSVAAHGFISKPTPRQPGQGLKAACGDQVFNQQSSDKFGNVQGSIQNMQGSNNPDCRIWQCKGVPFEDAGEVFDYTPGQKIPMEITIRAPHDGVANVSVVKVSSDTVIGEPLISFDKYALTSVSLDSHPEWTKFDITMPDVSAECANAGDCVIQWFWDAPSIDQTYESCIDFKMGGGSGSAPSTPGNSTAPISSPAPSKPSAPAAKPTPTKVAEVATPSSTAGAGSGNGAVPETFTVTTFIAWLKENAGSEAANKIRRMVAAKGEHARAFRV